VDHELKSEYRGDIHMLLPRYPLIATLKCRGITSRLPKISAAMAAVCSQSTPPPRSAPLHRQRDLFALQIDGRGIVEPTPTRPIRSAKSDFYTEPACYLAPASRTSDECRWAAWG